MATIALNLSPQDAVATQQDAYEVLLDDWGTNVNDSYPPVQSNDFSATGFHGLPWSPAAIVIGPRSTVDRAWFSWNPILDSLFLTQSTAVPRIATFESPIYFPTPAGDGFIPKGEANPMGAALLAKVLYAFPTALDLVNVVGGTGLPQHYLKADGTQQIFFIDGFPDFNQQRVPGLVTPQLHLQFFRRAPALAPGSKRLPLRIQRSDGFNFADASEISVAVVPIYGRKNVVFTFQSAQATATFRVATLRAMSFTTVSQEVTDGMVNTLAANESGKIVLSNPCADYALLYITPTAPGIVAGGWSVTAYD